MILRKLWNLTMRIVELRIRMIMCEDESLVRNIFIKFINLPITFYLIIIFPHNFFVFQYICPTNP